MRIAESKFSFISSKSRSARIYKKICLAGNPAQKSPRSEEANHKVQEKGSRGKVRKGTDLPCLVCMRIAQNKKILPRSKSLVQNENILFGRECDLNRKPNATPLSLPQRETCCLARRERRFSLFFGSCEFCIVQNERQGKRCSVRRLREQA